MSRFGTKRIGGLALAVASLTALAACSSSSSSSSRALPTSPGTNGAITQPGSIGEIPAAGTPSGTAGSITYALAPGAVPNWILPMPTSATNSVYNVFNFEWQMWPPMYYAPSGSTPTIDPSLSVANPPTWSNGDKTMTITLKPWKWSNGQTISSKDLQFTFDMIKAAVKASPANWAYYVPGYFPDIVTSMSTPNASTIVVNLSKAVNPTWMEYDILGSIPIMPSSAWSKESASRVDRGLHEPGQRGQDLRLPDRAVQVGVHLRDQPAVADRLRTVQAELVQRHHRRVHDGAEHQLQRTARQPHVHLRGRAVHLERGGVERRQDRVGRLRLRPAGRRAAAPAAQGARLQLLRPAGLRQLLRGLQLQGHDRQLQRRRQPAVLPAGHAAPGGPGRPDQGLLQRGRRPGLRTDPGLPEEPVPARQRGDQPLPVQRPVRDDRAEGQRLERRRERHRHLREAGDGHR